MTLIGQQAPPPGGYQIGIFEGHIATMARDLAAMQASGDRRAVFQLTYLTFSREVLVGVRADTLRGSRLGDRHVLPLRRGLPRAEGAMGAS